MAENKEKGVRSTHPEYDEYLPDWTRCEDVIEGGTRRLREEHNKYLPRYHEEADEQYLARINRTVLVNYSYRTLVGYKGMLLRKPAVVEVPDTVKPLLDDVTLSGQPFAIFLGETIEQVLSKGRCGIWVNHPPTDGTETKADVDRLNLRPSMHIFEAEAIDNWSHRRINNKYQLSMVKIKEERCEQLDEFTVEKKEVYRVLDLQDQPDGSVAYRVRIIEAEKEGSKETVLEEYYPIMNGEPLQHIPFDFLGPDDNEADPDAPPFVDLVDVNLTHFEQMSAFLHGCFWSGIPQPWISGVQLQPNEKLRIGGSAWVFPNPGAKAAMMEVGTAGFPALEKMLDRLETQMVILGSRLLETHAPGGQEGVQTAQVHLSGEHSVLASIGKSISVGLTRRLKDFVEWAGADSSNVKVHLNEDYFNEPLTPQARLSIVKSWQSGAISDEAKFNLLKQGGDYLPDETFEGEQKKISESTPPAESGSTTIPDQPLTDQVNATVVANGDA